MIKKNNLQKEKGMTIIVNAFTAFNLGDDLFLKILFERYPKTKFKLIAPIDYESFGSIYPNVTIVDLYQLNFHQKFFLKITSFSKTMYVDRFLKTRLKEISHNSDGYINVGGSIFIQESNEIGGNDKLNQLFNIQFDSKLKCIIGANFGPYTTEEYFLYYKSIFENFDDICFRDDFSYNLFKKLKNVRVAPDIVFQLKYKEIKKNKKTVGFSLIELSKREGLEVYSKEYYSTFYKLIKLYIAKGFTVYLFSFCKIQGDEDIIKDILNDLNEFERSNIKQVFYNGNINEFLNSFGSVENMYCTRFHSMILSMIFGQNFYPIVYSKKMTDCLDYIGFDGKFSLIKDLNSKGVEDFFNLMDNNKFIPKVQLEEAQDHFKILDEYLL
tara:strand:- start:149 stop:1297 length:1149 start_codon:yes stop_codon:yes gene_type:complete